MRKAIFILLLLSSFMGFSQENYTKISKESVSVKSTDIGLNIGNSKGFKPDLVHSWSIPSSESEKNAKVLVSSLAASLKEFGFTPSDFKFKENTLFFNSKFATEIPAEKFIGACKNAGFTYLIIAEKTKFINSK